MKRFLTVFLLSSLIFPLTGSIIYFKFQSSKIKRAVKHQIIEGIDKSELVLLSFSEQERVKLNWKHSKEFEYKNEMYDIVYTEYSNDTTHYWCWWDFKETELNKQLNKVVLHILGQNPGRKNEIDRVFLFYKTLFISIENQLNPITLVSIIKIMIDDFSINSLSYPPKIPPPKFIFNK